MPQNFEPGSGSFPALLFCNACVGADAFVRPAKRSDRPRENGSKHAPPDECAGGYVCLGEESAPERRRAGNSRIAYPVSADMIEPVMVRNREDA